MRSLVFTKVSRTSSKCVHGELPLTLHTQLGVPCPFKKKASTKKNWSKTHATHEREEEWRSSQNYFMKGDTVFELLFVSWSEFERYHELISKGRASYCFWCVQMCEREKFIFVISPQACICNWGQFGVPISNEVYLAPRGGYSSK